MGLRRSTRTFQPHGLAATGAALYVPCLGPAQSVAIITSEALMTA